MCGFSVLCGRFRAGARAVAVVLLCGAWGSRALGATPARVFPRAGVAPALRSAAVGRVDVVGIGDSNELFGGHGWDEGWTKALHARFGLFATALLAPGENSGNGAGVGWGCGVFSTLGSGQFRYSGAPALQESYLPASPWMRPQNYLYVGAGEVAATGSNNGVYVLRSGGVDVDSRLRFHFSFATFPGAASAGFTPVVRLQQPPYSTLATGGVVGVDGPGAPSHGWVEVPAAPRGADLNMRINAFGAPLAGPFLLYSMRAEVVDRPEGASFTTLYGDGGRTARDMAERLILAPDNQLLLFFGRLRALQGEGARRVVVRVNTGLNDRNETRVSIGPAPALPGNSGAAFADNLRAIALRLRAVWALGEWPEDELFLVFTVSHPVSDPDDALLEAYRREAARVCAEFPRCAAVNLAALTNAAEMLALGWYQSGGADRNHLTAQAFEALGARELDALCAPHCPGDANEDGVTDFLDLNLVLTDYGATEFGLAADLDADGFVGFTDLVGVLGAYGWVCGR